MKPLTISDPVGTVQMRSICTSVVFVLILLCVGRVFAWVPPPILHSLNDVTAGDTSVEIEAQVKGDLNGDSKGDVVFVIKRPVPGGNTIAQIEDDRTLAIYFQMQNGTYSLAETSNYAVLCSTCGGMMVDPFVVEELRIINGVIQIGHDGGYAHARWHTTDKYRYQNGAFYWIGYTGLTDGFGSAVLTDANLSTGKVVYSWTDNYDYPTEPSVLQHAITKKIKIKSETLRDKETFHKKKGTDELTPAEKLITSQNPFWDKLK